MVFQRSHKTICDYPSMILRSSVNLLHGLMFCRHVHETAAILAYKRVSQDVENQYEDTR